MPRSSAAAARVRSDAEESSCIRCVTSTVLTWVRVRVRGRVRVAASGASRAL